MATRAPRSRLELPLNDATFGVKPMLAKAGELPVGPEWKYEIKWDGIRALVRVDDHGVTIITRNGINVTGRYPEFQDLGLHIPHIAKPLLLDGEIVAFDESGMPVFARLQRRMNLQSLTEVARVRESAPAHLAVFDLPVMAGRRLTTLAYSDRRKLLERLEIETAHVSVPATYDDGAGLLTAMVERGMEGVIAKRIAAPYQAGRRTSDWTKVKCRPRQELVIGGYTRGTGNREGTFGALLLGVHEEKDDSGQLTYMGNVGSGFDDALLERLANQFDTMGRETSPFSGPVEPKDAKFIDPVLVAEIEYTDVTPEGRLRHPVFKGLRDDKDARDVIFEGIKR